MWIKPGRLDLTYCTNIHAGESWAEVERSLHSYAPPLKARLSPDAPFGLGLRLSAAAASELLLEDRLPRFRAWLDGHGLYVALLNGFPYGSFHGEAVKTEVFAPDWRSPERVLYTLDLAHILSRLLPGGMDGGISTLPFSYKPWVPNVAEAWPTFAAHLAEVAAALVGIHRRTGSLLHLDLEPEPDGLLETTAELVAFFDGPLREEAAPVLADRLACSLDEARRLLRDHIRVCFDSCHMAIQFEDAAASIALLRAHGIFIGRLQISSAVRLPPGGRPSEQLAPFARDSVYLHQVVARDRRGVLYRFPDLPDALAAAVPPSEWRVHFHVPLFTERHGEALSTQAENRALLALAAAGDVSPHLEIETYTWDVLPEPLRGDLLGSIEREYRWVLDSLAAAG